MKEILVLIMSLSVLTFVITDILAMGLSLTVTEIIRPLRKIRPVILALIANFLVVPLAAYLILLFIPLEEGLRNGLIILAAAAGGPFLPKLVHAAKGNQAVSVALMTLLMVATVVYMPNVLPFVLQGVQVNALDIAKSLVIWMLIPLGVGLFVRARYKSVAESLYPHMSHASSLSFILLLVSALALSFRNIIDVIGTGAILTVLLFLVISLLSGYFMGGKDTRIRSVLGLGAAQRNIGAALLVATRNFPDNSDVLTMIVVAGVIGLVMLTIVAGELGRRSAQRRVK